MSIKTYVNWLPYTQIEEITEKEGVTGLKDGDPHYFRALCFKMYMYKGFPAKKTKTFLVSKIFTFLGQVGKSRIVSGHYIKYTNTNAG